MTATRALAAVGMVLGLGILLNGCSPSPTTMPTATPSPATTAPLSLAPTIAATLVSTPTPSATSTPISGRVALSGTLLVDSAAGRLYAPGSLDGVPKTLVLAATDGHLLAAYNITGTLGLDRAHGWLYVDGPEGVTILNAGTGIVHAAVQLPAARRPSSRWFPTQAPLADSTAGLGLAFRDDVLYVFDPLDARIVRTISFKSMVVSHGSQVDSPLTVDMAALDSGRRILYLHLTKFFCYVDPRDDTLLSYDLEAGVKLASQPVLVRTMAVSDGYLYVETAYCKVSGEGQSIWRSGYPWREIRDWSTVTAGTLAVDTKRAQIYRISRSELLVFDMPDMNLSMNIASPRAGSLAGYDPVTNQLYFLADGKLQRWSPTALQNMTPEPPIQERPSSGWVRSLAWASDGTWFGLWGGTAGRLLYTSRDAGQTWSGLRGGLPSQENLSWASVVLSPDYATDRTLLVSVSGRGIYRSVDGGGQWQPVSAGLSSVGTDQLWISPGFSRDRTAFVHFYSAVLPYYRSLDGGDTWQPLGAVTGTYLLDVSPHFEYDRTLLSFGRASGNLWGEPVECRDQVNNVYRSRDAGTNWETLRTLPAGTFFTALNFAPSRLGESLVYAFGGDCRGSDGWQLYHSSDGGQNWSIVWTAPDPRAYPGPSRIVYSPDFATTGEMFALFQRQELRDDRYVLVSALYRSTDRGTTWEAMSLPGNVSPTAVTLSPNFARDGQLLVGTADGQVLLITRR